MVTAVVNSGMSPRDVVKRGAVTPQSPQTLDPPSPRCSNVSTRPLTPAYTPSCVPAQRGCSSSPAVLISPGFPSPSSNVSQASSCGPRPSSLEGTTTARDSLRAAPPRTCLPSTASKPSCATPPCTHRHDRLLGTPAQLAPQPQFPSSPPRFPLAAIRLPSRTRRAEDVPKRRHTAEEIRTSIAFRVACHSRHRLWFPRCIGPLAQLVEHLTFNQVVEGSIPSRPTNNPLIHNYILGTLVFYPGKQTALTPCHLSVGLGDFAPWVGRDSMVHQG